MKEKKDRKTWYNELALDDKKKTIFFISIVHSETYVNMICYATAKIACETFIL